MLMTGPVVAQIVNPDSLQQVLDGDVPGSPSADTTLSFSTSTDIDVENLSIAYSAIAGFIDLPEGYLNGIFSIWKDNAVDSVEIDTSVTINIVVDDTTLLSDTLLSTNQMNKKDVLRQFSQGRILFGAGRGLFRSDYYQSMFDKVGPAFFVGRLVSLDNGNIDFSCRATTHGYLSNAIPTDEGNAFPESVDNATPELESLFNLTYSDLQFIPVIKNESQNVIYYGGVGPYGSFLHPKYRGEEGNSFGYGMRVALGVVFIDNGTETITLEYSRSKGRVSNSNYDHKANSASLHMQTNGPIGVMAMMSWGSFAENNNKSFDLFTVKLTYRFSESEKADLNGLL